MLDKKLLRKRLIIIDEIINKIYSLTHLGNFLGFMIWFIIIFFIDIIIILWLYSNKGVMYGAEPTVKVSIFTLVISSSFSFITLLYFRYKDKQREYDKVKVEIYNELLRMLYINYEVIKEYFVSYIEKETEVQTIKKHPIYKLWNDIKHDYRGLLTDSLLNNYMNEIFDSYDEYFKLYKYSEEELYNEITKVLKNNLINTYIVRNCGCILYDYVYKQSDKLVDSLIFCGNSLNIKKKKEINDLIVNIIKSNVNYNKMIETYNRVKDLHQKVIVFLQRKIIDYYY